MTTHPRTPMPTRMSEASRRARRVDERTPGFTRWPIHLRLFRKPGR
jgi:hypothetical protein